MNSVKVTAATKPAINLFAFIVLLSEPSLTSSFWHGGANCGRPRWTVHLQNWGSFSKERGKLYGFPSRVRGVLATAHDTESHQPPAKDHRQRPENPRRREAAGVREHGRGRCRGGRRGRRTCAGRSGRARGSRGAAHRAR